MQIRYLRSQDNLNRSNLLENDSINLGLELLEKILSMTTLCAVGTMREMVKQVVENMSTEYSHGPVNTESILRLEIYSE